jgi:hypothetical protein
LKRPVDNKTIKIVPIKDFRMLREFNFIFLTDDDDRFRQGFITFCREQVLQPGCGNGYI